MQATKPELDAEFFFDQLARAETSALLLDYDGTLAPFSTDRDRAFPYPTVPELLERIMSTGRTRLVVVTGRRAADVLTLLPVTPFPEVWGAHGLERLKCDGSYELLAVDEHTQRALAEADARLRLEGLDKLAEIKPGSIAVHWRGYSDAAVDEIRAKAYRAWSLLARREGLKFLEFDGGLELRVPSRDKGDAVRTVLAELPDSAPVAFLGDDQTDESAFRALKRRGLCVLVRPALRQTEADLWLEPPEDVVQFLVTWLRACGGEL